MHKRTGQRVDLVKTMKRITANRKTRRLPAAVRQEILRTKGGMAEVAAKAGVDRAYVYRVVATREKPCSEKLWDAIVAWMSQPKSIGPVRDMAREELRQLQEIA